MKEIDIDSWNRREIYNHFSAVDCPFYAVTIPIDVTNVKATASTHNISFYHLMVWLCTKAVNKIPAFRMRIRDGRLYELDQTYPGFTSMERGEDTFKYITAPWSDDFVEFANLASEISATQKGLFGDVESTDELLYISCSPWFDFTGLTNARNIDPSDTIPRFIWGKYYPEGERLLMHLSIDVNHRTIDGYHIGQFKEALDREIANIK